jgi:hypothetical protein
MSNEQMMEVSCLKFKLFSGCPLHESVLEICKEKDVEKAEET